MKKNILFSCVLLIVLILSLLYIYLVATRKIDLRNKQEALAKSMGVRIDDYPYKVTFPVGYFDSALEPGMTYDEVHRIVRGYERVYRCYGFTEIYYYYSTNHDDAIRFGLVYDDQSQFVELRGEDPESRTLGLGPGCSVGLLRDQ